MRVLLSIERFSPHYGGAERYAVDLARGLVAAGVDVHVASESFSDVPDGVQTVPISPFSWPKGLRVYDFGKRTADVADDFDVVHGLGKTWAVDVFHPHTGSHRASLAALRSSHEGLGLRMATTLLQALSFKQAVFRWIEKRQYGSGRVKRFIAVSRKVAEDMKTLHGAPEARIEVLYNPVDMNRFRPGKGGEREGVRSRFGIDPDAALCLFIGHHFRLKGLRTLLKALARVGEKGPTLLVLGRGKVDLFTRLAREAGLEDRVTFAGATIEPEEFYRSADLFVLPTFYDPCSLTVLEAMASGLPVITTRRNGASELLTSGREGFILDDPRRDDILASFIEELADPRKRRDMGARGRERVEGLSPETHLQAVLDVYEDVVRASVR